MPQEYLIWFQINDLENSKCVADLMNKTILQIKFLELKPVPIIAMATMLITKILQLP